MGFKGERELKFNRLHGFRVNCMNATRFPELSETIHVAVDAMFSVHHFASNEYMVGEIRAQMENSALRCLAAMTPSRGLAGAFDGGQSGMSEAFSVRSMNHLAAIEVAATEPPRITI